MKSSKMNYTMDNFLGITRRSLQNRLEAGWSLERALTEGKRGKKHE
jgi:hypothetical protein